MPEEILGGPDHWKCFASCPLSHPAGRVAEAHAGSLGRASREREYGRDGDGRGLVIDLAIRRGPSIQGRTDPISCRTSIFFQRVIEPRIRARRPIGHLA